MLQYIQACTVIQDPSMTGRQDLVRDCTPPLASFHLLILMGCQITIRQHELKTAQPTHHLEGGGEGVDYG